MVYRGNDQAYKITANSGYHIADVVVDGGSVGAVGTYTFHNVTTAHSIAATFAQNPPQSVTITASAGAGGSISPSGNVSVVVGTDQRFDITANSGYHIADVLVDGGSVGAVGSYTFHNVTAPHTIVASFAQNPPQTVTITAIAGAGGSISPSGNVSVVVGTDQGFSIAANNGYHIADVLVDGGSVGAVSSYTFHNVTAAHTISASFAQNAPETVIITASAGAGGSIQPSGDVSVAMGANENFSITPDPGYWIMDVVVDGVSIGPKSRYVFRNTREAHTISASFGPTITATAGSGGSISPSGTSDLAMGGNQTYTMNANKKFHISDVAVDGSSMGAVESFTFGNVTAPHTIAATFSR